jgi:hypothetical protein
MERVIEYFTQISKPRIGRPSSSSSIAIYVPHALVIFHWCHRIIAVAILVTVVSNSAFLGWDFFAHVPLIASGGVGGGEPCVRVVIGGGSAVMLLRFLGGVGGGSLVAYGGGGSAIVSGF